MTNAELFKEKLNKYWKKRDSHINGYNPFEWANAEADFALLFEEGQLVKVDDRYGIIRETVYNCHEPTVDVKVDFGSETLVVHATSVKTTNIPEILLRYMNDKIRSESKRISDERTASLERACNEKIEETNSECDADINKIKRECDAKIDKIKRECDAKVKNAEATITKIKELLYRNEYEDDYGDD